MSIITRDPIADLRPPMKPKRKYVRKTPTAVQVTTAEKAVSEVSSAVGLMPAIVRLQSADEVDVDKIERLVSLHLTLMQEARIAEFTRAWLEVQAEMPVIPRRGGPRMINGRAVKYPLYEDIDAGAQPVLKRHGFCLALSCTQTTSHVTVTAELTHVAGHRKDASFTLPFGGTSADAIASATTQAKRQAVIILLNIKSPEADEGDAAANDTPPVPADRLTCKQVATLRELLTTVKGTEADERRLVKVLNGTDTFETIPATAFKRAMAEIALLGGGK